MTATGRILLAQQQHGLPGLLALMPVYRRGLEAEGVALRRSELQGFAAAILRLDPLMEPTVAAARREGLVIALLDDSAGGEAVYRYPPQAAERAAGGLHREILFAFGGRALRLVFDLPAQVLLARRSWATWLVLAGGLLVTSLFGMLLLLGVGRTARVQSLVDDRTDELRRLNASLIAEAQRRRRLEQEAENRASELSQSNVELQRREEANRQLLLSLHNSEEELRRTGSQLSASNRELEQFAYVASHDLKAPLRSIGSFAQLLGRRHSDRLDDESKEFLGFIQEGIRQMQTLIDDLLQLSRVDARRLEPGPVSMRSVVDRACRQLTADLAASGAVMHVGTLPEVHADFNMLVQLLQNLIGNGLKFQPANQRPEIWVDASAEVVNLHGGEIWVESTVGTGTGVHFTLPQHGDPPVA